MENIEKEIFIRNLINWLKLAKEFAFSPIQEIFELGHYLADNLLCKVCIFIAINEGRKEEIWKKERGKKTNFTKSHKKLYITFLEANKKFSVESYKPNLEFLHKKRNFYQHDPKSMEYGLRSADSIKYVEKVEEIMKKVGIIKSNDQTEPSNYLRSSPIFSSIREKRNQDQEGWQRFYDLMSSINRDNFGIDIQEILNNIINQNDFAKVLKMDCGSGYDKYFKSYMNNKWEFQFISYRMASPIRYEVKLIDKISKQEYNYSNPNENIDILNKWLKYINNCCKNEGIKINT